MWSDSLRMESLHCDSRSEATLGLESGNWPDTASIRSYDSSESDDEAHILVVHDEPVRVPDESDPIQDLQRLLRKLRLECKPTTFQLPAPPGQASGEWISMQKITDHYGVAVTSRYARAPRKKEAEKNSARQILYDLKCLYARSFDRKVLEMPANIPILRFEVPPDHWFFEPTVLGVDFEGPSKHLVQIACDHGVAIDRIDATWVQDVLRNPHHVHFIFGAHEARLVANPVNVQVDVHGQAISLEEAYARLFDPSSRYCKHKHKGNGDECARTRHIEDDFALYAATDAWATLQIGKARARAAFLFPRP